jgi:ABC-type Co2+ transport system permease subunit
MQDYKLTALIPIGHWPLTYPIKTYSTIKIENRSEKISKKPKIGVCTLFSNLDNILKVLMYSLGAFSIMTSFLFDFPNELLYC